MKPALFEAYIQKNGEVEHYTAGQIFHAHDFPNKLFYLKDGYVKRYQARRLEHKVLELIYGPGHIISLSQLYKMLFGLDQNQDNFIYVYQAMTDVDVCSIDADVVIKELEKTPEMYRDFFYESGIKLRSNIFRLASNSLKDDVKKVAHQLASMAYEFGVSGNGDSQKVVSLPFPQTPLDLAEQLNISTAATEAALDNLVQKSIVSLDGNNITILDIDVLKDVYL